MSEYNDMTHDTLITWKIMSPVMPLFPIFYFIIAVRFCLPACLCSQASSASVAVRSCLLALIVVSIITLLPIVSSCLLVTVPYMAILRIVSLSPVPLRNISSSGHWTRHLACKQRPFVSEAHRELQVANFL